MDQIKEKYKVYADDIFEKKVNSPYLLRRHVHYSQVSSILDHVREGQKVLDAGCGDGTLAALMAKKGALVTACDISLPNIENAKRLWCSQDARNEPRFLAADVESLPFEDDSFDVVVSSHVLEHLPNFQKGLGEIKRVSKQTIIIGLPTCLNVCAVSLLGGAEYWYLRKKSFIALPKGILRIILNIFKDGVDEGYSQYKLPHLRRYPWIVRKELEAAGLRIIHFAADSLCLPYFDFFLPIIKFLDRFRSQPVFRNFGVGVIVVAEK